MQLHLDHLIDVLASPATDSTQSLVLSGGSGLALRVADALAAAPAGAFVSLTLEADGDRMDPDAAREIVYCMAVTDDTLSVARAKEGTIALAWPAGTVVEGRLTADAVRRMPISAPGGDVLGAGSLSLQPSRSLAAEVASGARAIAMGVDSQAAAEDGIAIGYQSGAAGAGSIAIHGWVDPDEGIAVGRESYTGGEGGVAVGHAATVDWGADEGIAIGESAYVSAGTAQVALGPRGYITASRAVALGPDTTVYGARGIALGSRAFAAEASVMHLTALPWHIDAFWGSDITDALERTAYLAAIPIRLMTDPLDLATLNDSQTFTLPDNSRLFIEEAGLVLTSVNSPAGTPTLSFTNELTDEEVTISAAWERQVWPVVTNGLAGTLTVTVTAALTSGAASARFYVSGWLMQA